jgi:hypothetical protein
MGTFAPAIIGLIGVFLGASISTGTTYFLAIRKEASEERNWRRDHVLEAYSDLLGAIEIVISETTFAYSAGCGTDDHAKHSLMAVEKANEMHRAHDRVVLLAPEVLQSFSDDLTKFITAELLITSIQCPKISNDERKAINSKLAGLMSAFVLAARYGTGVHPLPVGLEKTKNPWWQFWR